MRLRLIVDGTVYGFQPYGGINSIFNAILPRLAMRTDTTVDLLLPNPCVAPVRPSGHVRLRTRDLIPTTNLSWKLDRTIEAINHALIGARVALSPNAVFQSTYFTMLPSGWPQAAIVHDLNHELFPEEYETEFGQWLRRVYPRYLHRARRIVAVSETTKRHAVQFYGIDSEKIDVAHLGVEPEIFFVDRSPDRLAQLEKDLHVRRPYLLFVGLRVGPYKNFRRLLDAFVLVAEQHDLMLVVAGARWSKTEQAFIETYRAKRRLLLIEYPPQHVLRALYNFATAFVFPSSWEGFGLPLVEAMACGTVIVASSTEIFREVAGDVPIYFDPSDTNDLAGAIDVVARGDATHEVISRGLMRAQKFSWDRCAEKFYTAYAKVRSSDR